MKSVLITGTSKGLGYALAEEFLKKSWLVFALARDVSKLSELTDLYKGACILIQSDVTDESCSELISNEIKSRTDKLDLLINNAGNAELHFKLDDVTPENLEGHFKVHVSGAFRVIKACLPFLAESSEASILNISSRKGSINRINSGAYRVLLPYQIAKAAQNMLSVGLNQLLQNTNIKVYAVHPGNLKTDVAPIDADTEAYESAKEIYCWINGNPSHELFYSIMEKTNIEW